MRKTYFAQRNEVGGIDVKFRDWFSLKAIRSEIKRISWLSKKQLAQNSAIVLLFCFVLGLYFFSCDAVIALIFKALGIN